MIRSAPQQSAGWNAVHLLGRIPQAQTGERLKGLSAPADVVDFAAAAAHVTAEMAHSRRMSTENDLSVQPQQGIASLVQADMRSWQENMASLRRTSSAFMAPAVQQVSHRALVSSQG